MRQVIETLPAPEALKKYPPETQMAATYPGGYGNRYYNGVEFQHCPLEEAKIWTLKEASNWGGHMMCRILKTRLTEEELVTLPLGRRTFAILDQSPDMATESGYTRESILSEAKLIGNDLTVATNPTTTVVICAMLCMGEFRQQLLTLDEQTMLQNALERIRAQYNQAKAVTPAQKLCAALTAQRGDIF